MRRLLTHHVYLNEIWNFLMNASPQAHLCIYFNLTVKRTQGAKCYPHTQRTFLNKLKDFNYSIVDKDFRFQWLSMVWHWPDATSHPCDFIFVINSSLKFYYTRAPTRYFPRTRSWLRRMSVTLQILFSRSGLTLSSMIKRCWPPEGRRRHHTIKLPRAIPINISSCWFAQCWVLNH